MIDVQKEMLKLLIEIKEICGRYKLNYVLSPRMVAHGVSFGGFGKHIFIPSVLMPIGDMLRFIEIIGENNQTGREIEYMGNSANYPEYSVSYVNSDTSFFVMRDGTNSQKHGIRVKIVPIRPQVENFFLGVLETGWGDNGFNDLAKRDKKRLIGKKLIKMMTLFGKKDVAKWIFEYFSEKYTKGNDSVRVFIKELKRPRIYFSRKLISQTKEIEFEGDRFLVPENIDEYLEKGVSKIWKDALANWKNKDDIIMASNIPYALMIKALDDNGIELNELVKKYGIIGEAERKNIELRYSKDDAWYTALRSGDRLKLYEELSPEWEKIKELKEKEDYDELEKIFYRYDGLAKYYMNRRNLGLCPSKELLMIECELMRRRGEGELADKLLSMVPEEHFKPVVQ